MVTWRDLISSAVERKAAIDAVQSVCHLADTDPGPDWVYTRPQPCGAARRAVSAMLRDDAEYTIERGRAEVSFAIELAKDILSAHKGDNRRGLVSHSAEFLWYDWIRSWETYLMVNQAAFFALSGDAEGAKKTVEEVVARVA